MIHLTLQVPTTIPIELDGVTPDRLAGKTAADVAKIPVLHGNRREPLGELFSVVESEQTFADIEISGDLIAVKSIGAGMKSGTMWADNDVGMHAGARMSGGRLIIDGSAADRLGAEMSGGIIDVVGNAGDEVGASCVGSSHGMTGGTIMIRRNVGNNLGERMRRGTIIVKGSVGAFTGASMIAGTIIANGSVGHGCGAGMKRGTIVLLGSEPEFGPGFIESGEFATPFLTLLFKRLHELLPFDEFHELAKRDLSPRCWRGDAVNRGLGEILMIAKPSGVVSRP